VHTSQSHRRRAVQDEILGRGQRLQMERYEATARSSAQHRGYQAVPIPRTRRAWRRSRTGEIDLIYHRSSVSAHLIRRPARAVRRPNRGP